MKKITLLLVIVLLLSKTQAQFVHVIKADSVLITNDSCTAELNLENSTKDIKGFLYNKGNGRTEFRKFVKLNDTTFIMGGDTLIIGGSGASRNFANSDLTFDADHTHDGNHKGLYLDDFGYMELKANTIDGSIRSKMYLDTLGIFGTQSKYFYNEVDPDGYFEIHAATTEDERSTLYLSAGHMSIQMQQITAQASSLVSYGVNSLAHHVNGAYIEDSTLHSGIIQVEDSLQLSVNLLNMDNGLGQSIEYRRNEHSQRKDSTYNYIFQNHKTTGSLLKRTDFDQGLSSFTFKASGSSNPNLLFYVKSLPTSIDSATYKPVGISSTGQMVSMGNWAPPSTLQQVTANGNTTTNTIKPYPSALPVGASTDSIVVWSAADSLLKKIAPKQTFSQTETVTVTGTTSETTLIGNGTGSLTIPSEAWAVGKSYRVIIHGVYSTTSSSPANINIRLKFGSTVIATSGTIFLSSNKSNVPFTLQATITCRSTGSSGTIYTFGQIFRDGNTNVINNGTSASTINTTTSQTLNATVQLSENSVGNSVSAYVVILDPIN